MKVFLALLLILLLILVALPIGMSHMGDCPACTSAKASLILGLCAGILAVLALIVLLASTRFRPVSGVARRYLDVRSIYRPPRAV